MNSQQTSQLIWQDTQHQEIFRIIDMLKTSDGREALDILVLYINQHFHLEEQYMSKLNFPHAEEHIREHRSFERKIQDLISNQSIFDENFARSLSDYLKSWLNSHLLGIDKELEAFILASDAK